MPRLLAPFLTALAALSLVACSHGSTPTDLGTNGDLGSDPDLAGALDLASACPRTPRPDDADRWIVVSHPYSAASAKANDYEALTLDSTGKIGRPGYHFTMGRGMGGTIAFTADGALGYVVQDDGSIGVFRLHDGGAPEVVEAVHKGAYYADVLGVSLAGDHLYVVDSETENNGGGVYDVPIACDGTLGQEQKLSAADVPYALLALPGGEAALYARALSGATAGQSVHRVKLGPPFMRVASATAFSTASDEAIVASSALTHDGKWALFGDNSQFSSVANRVAAVAITAGGLGAAQELTPIDDPVALVTSPYDNAVMVVSGFKNAILSLAYDPQNASAPFTVQGAITYTGAKPELPGGAVLIERGALKGMVYVAENLGIRPVRFETSGKLTDLGKYATGTGTENIVGAIGVTP